MLDKNLNTEIICTLTFLKRTTINVREAAVEKINTCLLSDVESVVEVDLCSDARYYFFRAIMNTESMTR